MRALHVFTLAVGCGVFQWSSHAEEIPLASSKNRVISSDFITRLVMEAGTNNPGQLAFDWRAKAAAANVGSVRVWDDPTFTLGGSVFSPRGFDAAEEGDLSYGIEQKLPLWGMPKLNRQVAAAELNTRAAEADYHRQQLRRDITKALVAAALAEQVVNLGEQDLAWLQTISQAVEAKYRTGQTDAGDALTIQNEVALRQDQLRTDRLELAHAQFVLNRLLNRDIRSPWPVLQLPAIAPPVPYSAKLLDLALANEPELKIADGEIERARAAAELAHRSRLPDISLGIEGNQYSGDGGFRSGTFSLSFPLPWGNSGKYRKDYERELDNARAAEREREDQTLMIQEELSHLAIDLDSARREALLYGNDITTRAGQALTDKMAAWQSGHVTLREVLDTHRDVLEAQLMMARSIANQYQSLAELLLWTGLDNFEALVPLANEPDIAHHHNE